MSGILRARLQFAALLAGLITRANGGAVGVTVGEVYRSAAEARRLAASGAGVLKSLHTEGLAVDLNLYVGGVYQTQTAAYAALGAWWEAQDPACRWGGRFRRPDGNHFSLAIDRRA